MCMTKNKNEQILSCFSNNRQKTSCIYNGLPWLLVTVVTQAVSITGYHGYTSCIYNSHCVNVYHVYAPAKM